MDAFAVSRAPAAALKSFWIFRSVFGVVHNLSIQIKASAASAVLLICLLGPRRQRLHDVDKIRGRFADVVVSARAETAGALRRQRRHRRDSYEDLSLRVVGEQQREQELCSTPFTTRSRPTLPACRIASARSAAARTCPPKNAPPSKDFLTRWEKCKSQAKDTIDVGQTDAPMATMMLGQTDDSFKAVDADIQKMSITTTETANAVRAGSTPMPSEPSKSSSWAPFWVLWSALSSPSWSAHRSCGRSNRSPA